MASLTSLPRYRQAREDEAFNIDSAILEETFTTNVLGPVYVSQAFVGLVEKSAKKTIVNISSTVGSIGSDFGTKGASYAISKAALNMLVRGLSRLSIGRFANDASGVCRADVQGVEGEAGPHRDLYVPRMAADRSVHLFQLLRRTK